jgi:hypothetical protein
MRTAKVIVVTYSENFAFFFGGSEFDIFAGAESGGRRMESWRGSISADNCPVGELALGFRSVSDLMLLNNVVVVE